MTKSLSDELAKKSFLTEEWRPVEFCPTRYEISNFGKIRSLRHVTGAYDLLRTVPKELKLRELPSGHLYVSLYNNGLIGNYLIHRLVAHHFLGRSNNEMQCAHLDGNPKNNLFTNLKWCSCKENMSHKKIHGTSCVGEKNGRAKLKKEDVLKIRLLFKKGKTQSMIARQFKIKQTTVSEICLRKRWKHI